MILYNFYESACRIAMQHHAIPSIFDTLMYDSRYNYHSVCNSMKQDGEVDWISCGIFSCYGPIFSDLELSSDQFASLKFICDSSDIDDPEEVGDFDYFAGMMSYHIGVIYMRSTHSWALPSRAILYGPEAEVRFSNYEPKIEVSPVNQRVYQVLKSGIHLQEEIQRFLKYTDRPLIESYKEN